MDKTIHNKTYKSIITLLRSKRTKAGITQENLAKVLDVNQTVISKIETCERRLDIVELKLICDAINISFLDFAKEIDNIITKEP